MKDLSYFSKVYLASEPIDFRKQAGGLSLIVEHSFKLNPLSEKAVFIFTNRRRSAVKILYWDQTGFAMWWKTLEADKFRWPRGDEAVSTVDKKDLKLLLEGVDFSKIKRHKRIILD